MKRTLIASMFALTFAGCATIITGTTQSVTIKSVPEAAAISITNRAGEKIHSGNTPVTVALKRGAGYFKPESYTVNIQKEGFEPQEITISGQVTGWYFGNIIFGGIVLGMLIIDPLTGAMFSLSPDNVDAALSAVGAKASKNDGSLTVVLLEDVPAEIMAKARRLN
jgi:hypothetical protein